MKPSLENRVKEAYRNRRLLFHEPPSNIKDHLDLVRQVLASTPPPPEPGYSSRRPCSTSGIACRTT